jgi:hypothetical protein
MVMKTKAEYDRERYLANREKVIAQAAIRTAAYKRRNRDYVTELKTKNPCTDCGYNYPAVCMDFDHVRGTKVANVAALCSQGISLEKIDAELAKCELVCANCHRLRTASRVKATA